LLRPEESRTNVRGDEGRRRTKKGDEGQATVARSKLKIKNEKLRIKIMTKKTKILIIILFLGCFLVASQASAQGLVPCGQRENNPDTTWDDTNPCTLCHFFVLIERVLEFVFFKLTPPLALLMLVIGGGMFMLAAGDPQKITQARKIISSVFIGIVIVYGSFFLIGLLLQSIGLATWTETIYFDWWDKGIFNIDCPVP